MVSGSRWIRSYGILPAARRLWAETLREYLGADAPGLVGLEEAVFWSNPLKYPQQLRHWLRYLYRGPLYDLWKGWDKVDSLGCVHYKVWKLAGNRNGFIRKMRFWLRWNGLLILLGSGSGLSGSGRCRMVRKPKPCLVLVWKRPSRLMVRRRVGARSGNLSGSSGSFPGRMAAGLS